MKFLSKEGFKKYLKEIIHLYDDLYFTRTIKNDSALCRRLPKHSDKIGMDMVGTYNGENITFYYTIDSMPRELLIDFKSRIRKECRAGVRVNFLNHIRGHSIDWESRQMSSQLRILKQVGEENDNSDVDAYNLHKNINTIGKQSWIEESLSYLAVADMKRDRSLLKSSMLVMVSGKRGVDFDDTLKIVESYSKHIGVKLSRVLYDIPSVLQYFSPFSGNVFKGVASRMTTQVLTDEILARYNDYGQGTLGVRGCYFGTDVKSNFPVLKKVKIKTDTAENWLVTAKTGGGKSHAIKIMLLQLLSSNYNGTIMDIEGFEYIPIANFVGNKSKVVVINMAEGSGKYFDPVEISGTTGIEDIDIKAKSMSIDFTLATLKTLLGKAYDEDIQMDIVLNDAVSETYIRNNVTEDMSTWSSSEGLTLFDVYAMFFTLKKEQFRESKEYQLAIEKSLAILSKYFEPNGTRSNIFKERVLVGDIIDADLVVCSFGMAGKSEHSIDKVQLALMQLSAAQLSHQRSIFSKAQGKFNFKLWEEFQRWGKFPDSEKTIGVAVTGGRKLGDVNIIITNDLKALLEDDRFSIMGNITSYMVGAIGDEKARFDFCERLSIPHMKPELDLINMHNIESDEEEGDENNVPDSPLKYAFLCGLDNTKFGIVKFVLPEKLATSTLFKTGVDLNG